MMLTIPAALYAHFQKYVNTRRRTLSSLIGSLAVPNVRVFCCIQLPCSSY